MDAFPLSSDLLGKSASAYEHLRRAVSLGQLRPGRRLSATGLATAFRISETPVREALLRLGTEGFLAWEPSKGHFTKPVTLDEQTDLHELIVIHLTACLLRADAPPDPAVDAVFAAARAALDTPEDLAAAGEDTVRLVEALWASIVARSGNKVLASIMSVLLDRIALVRRLDLEAPDRILRARRQLAGLAAAVQNRDGATAVALMSVEFAERRSRLPQLVAAANAAAARATYP